MACGPHVHGPAQVEPQHIPTFSMGLGELRRAYMWDLDKETGPVCGRGEVPFRVRDDVSVREVLASEFEQLKRDRYADLPGRLHGRWAL